MKQKLNKISDKLKMCSFSHDWIENYNKQT